MATSGGGFDLAMYIISAQENFSQFLINYLKHLRLMIVKIFQMILCLRETFHSNLHEIAIL